MLPPALASLRFLPAALALLLAAAAQDFALISLVVLGTSAAAWSTKRLPRPEADAESVLPASLDQLQPLALLGTGTFGTVRLVAYGQHADGACVRTFALKTMPKAVLRHHRQELNTRTEAQLLSMMDHPFVVRLEQLFETPTACYLLLEPCLGGELFTLLQRNRGGIPQQHALLYTAMIVEALEYLHAQKVVYRDLKPENLLFDAWGYLKLVDFGFAKVVDGHTFTQCGTAEYMAPEILLSEGYGTGVDWWALGVLLFEMIVGHPTFIGETSEMLCHDIVRAEIRFPQLVSQDARDLIAGLLEPVVPCRLGCRGDDAHEVKSHPLLRGINWDALRGRTLPPPVVPELKDDFDVSHFDGFEDVHAEALAGPNDGLPQGIFEGIVPRTTVSASLRPVAG